MSDDFYLDDYEDDYNDWDEFDDEFDSLEDDYPDWDWLTVCSVCGDRECDSRGDGICHVCATQKWIDENG